MDVTTSWRCRRQSGVTWSRTVLRPRRVLGPNEFLTAATGLPHVGTLATGMAVVAETDGVHDPLTLFDVESEVRAAIELGRPLPVPTPVVDDVPFLGDVGDLDCDRMAVSRVVTEVDVVSAVTESGAPLTRDGLHLVASAGVRCGHTDRVRGSGRGGHCEQHSGQRPLRRTRRFRREQDPTSSWFGSSVRW
jgi:hypothetical protein